MGPNFSENFKITTFVGVLHFAVTEKLSVMNINLLNDYLNVIEICSIVCRRVVLLI